MTNKILDAIRTGVAALDKRFGYELINIGRGVPGRSPTSPANKKREKIDSVESLPT